MVPYIIADEPELSANETMDKSAKMMDGHKIELFVLILSFIGWGLLCLLTCGLGIIALCPYMEATFAEYYRNRKEEYERENPSAASANSGATFTVNA